MQLTPWKNRAPQSGGASVATPTRALGGEIDRLIENFFRDPWAWPTAGTTQASRLYPTVDLTETEEGFTIRADVPGVLPDDLDVTLEDGVLTLAGEKKETQRNDAEGWHLNERRFGAFRRSFALPTAVDENAIEARHENGVLTVVLKKAASAKPRKIKVQGA